MPKSKYGQIKKDAEKILAMKAAGYKKREIAEELGLTKEQIKAFLKRQRRKDRRIAAGFSAVRGKDVRPKVKYAVIYRHRDKYPISVMCKFFGVSRSGYYDFIKRIGRVEPDEALAKQIRQCQASSDNTYGFRRVWRWLERKHIHRNPKTVLRVMKKYGLLSEIRRRRKWVQLGWQAHKYQNHLKRQYRATRPNSKMVLFGLGPPRFH